MRKNKVTLVYPRSKIFSPTDKPGWNHEHLGIAYLAASLEDSGYQVCLINASAEALDNGGLLERIERTMPDVVGFSVTAFTVKEAIDLAHRLKARQPYIHVCFGGQHATCCADDLLRDFVSIDTVVRGDGEQTIVELLSALEERKLLHGIKGLWFRAEDGTVVKNPDRPGILDLDIIRLPKRTASAINAAQFGVNTSRGCIYNCHFCTTPEYSRLHGPPYWRCRSAYHVVKELASLAAFTPKGLKADISLLDDNFVIATSESKNRAKLIALELIKSGIDIRMWMMCGVRTFSVSNKSDQELLILLRRAGVDRIFVGIESGSEHSLQLFNKPTDVQTSLTTIYDLSSFGFSVHCTMILFHPYTTLSELKTNLEFIWELLSIPSVGMYTNLCSRLAVFPGTGLYRRLKVERLMTTFQPYLEPYPYRYVDDHVGFLSHHMLKLEPTFAALDWLVTDARTTACRQGWIASKPPEWYKMESVISNIHKAKTDFFSAALRCAEDLDHRSLEELTERTIEYLSRLQPLLIKSSTSASNSQHQVS